MPTALSRYRPQSRGRDTIFTFLDAKVLACSSDGEEVFTSPNMDFVPEPHINEEVLQARADGRFGPTDCFQWPQLHARNWEFSVCIPRQESHPAPEALAWAWYTPTRTDFRQCPDAPEGYGWLEESKLLGLGSLYQVASNRYTPWKAKRGDKFDVAGRWLHDVQHTITTLRSQPLPFVDIIGWVAYAQRTFLDVYSFMDYVEIVQPRIANPSAVAHPVHKDWMGCFTRDTAVCSDLFSAGVPVWLSRCKYTITDQTIIEKPVKYIFPDNICRAQYSEPGKPSMLFPCLYRGPGGSERHHHTRIRFTPSSASSQVPSHVGKAPTQAQMKKQSTKGKLVQKVRPFTPTPAGAKHGRNKWKESINPREPSSFQLWATAIKRVSRQILPSRPDHVDPGYRVPEPALLIGAQSAERCQRYLANWLAIRLCWIEEVKRDPRRRMPTPQMWRDLLNSSFSGQGAEIAVSTKTRVSKLAALEVFGQECVMLTLAGQLTLSEDVRWHDQDIPIATLSDPPPRLVRAILWEVYEVGFWCELHALDRAVVPQLWQKSSRARQETFDEIFPTLNGQPFWRAPLPKSPGSLGLTDLLVDNSSMLRCFRFLLSGWPDAPSSLGDLVPVGLTGDALRVWEFDRASRACFFYVDTFSRHFGRPPLVPHQFPPEYF